MTIHRAATFAVIALLSLQGCATTGGSMATTPSPPAWVPTIDTKGVNQAKYQKDYGECRAYAEADPSTNGKAQGKKGAMKWGIGGLALVGVATVLTAGAAAPAILPAMAAPAAVYGGTAAATGGISGKVVADAKYRNMVGSCLQGRGYKVLN